MNNPSTVEQLREMRFSAMATEFEAQIQDPTTYAQVSFGKNDNEILQHLLAGWF